jgi:hypothetical protein
MLYFFFYLFRQQSNPSSTSRGEAISPRLLLAPGFSVRLIITELMLGKTVGGRLPDGFFPK